MRTQDAGTPPLLGFSVLGGQPELLEQIRFEVPKHALAFGAYYWPTM